MRKLFYISCVLILLSNSVNAQDITFCGEAVPIEVPGVFKKLTAAVDKMNSLYFSGHNPNKTAHFLNYFAALLQAKGLPEDLKYIPIVESLLGNRTSRVGASGFWQIMPATGREIDLIVEQGYDEREDVVKASFAAMKYLSSLRKGAGNWTNATAAYNCGLGNVNKAVRNSGQRSYYHLPLPQETKEYVYRIIACKAIYEGYGKNFSFYKSAPEPKKFQTITAKQIPDVETAEILTVDPPKELDSVKYEVLFLKKLEDTLYQVDVRILENKMELLKGKNYAAAYFPLSNIIILYKGTEQLSILLTRKLKPGLIDYFSFKKV